jgi:hypothetical protein
MFAFIKTPTGKRELIEISRRNLRALEKDIADNRHIVAYGITVAKIYEIPRCAAHEHVIYGGVHHTALWVDGGKIKRAA